MQRLQFYLLAGRMARAACNAGHPADAGGRPAPDAGRSNPRKYQTCITSQAADPYLVRYPARARLLRIDVQAKNSLNVLSTPTGRARSLPRGR
ncbi:hypothetical protein [Burkholderia catarinensis]|uniref:hypothetical protein n=1 Tax=Burkholderia catarinensis TaxID=1108140 RepID=UPI001300EDDF|nr:hypothetical protein [Burkholderia catarinensis]